MPRISLDDYKEQKLEDALVVEAGGRDFTILPPELWAEEASQLDETDVRGFAAVALGGEAELDAFCAAGGSPVLVGSLFKDHYGAPGESSASPGSSASTVRPSSRTSSGTTGSASKKNLGRRA